MFPFVDFLYTFKCMDGKLRDLPKADAYLPLFRLPPSRTTVTGRCKVPALHTISLP